MNFEIGTHITITRGVRLGPQSGSIFGGLFGAPTATTTETARFDRSWLGAVLEVLTVDPPFIAVRCLVGKDGQPPYGGPRPFSINTDEVQLKALSEAYVQTMLSGLETKEN